MSVSMVGVFMGMMEMFVGVVRMFVLGVFVGIVGMFVVVVRMFTSIIGMFVSMLKMLVGVVRMFTAFRVRVAKVFRAFACAAVERDMYAGSKYAKPALARYLEPPASDPQCLQPPFKLCRIGPGVHKRAEIHIPAYARKTVVI